MLELSPNNPFKCVLNDTAKVPFIHFVFNSKTLKCLFSAIYICMFYTICFIALKFKEKLILSILLSVKITI